MRKQNLIWLIAAAVLAVGVAWLVADKRAPQGSAGDGALLVPGLSAALNDVTRIAIVAADGTPAVTLTRGEQAWRIAERDDYPADTGKVRKYLLDLADAALIEAKTARPENYPALGVVTPGEEGATGVLVTIDGVAGVQPFVVGNTARGGSYVRRIDHTQSWLSGTDVSVATSATDWLNRDIMDIDAADIVAVEIRHPDGEVVQARRGGVNLQLAELPAGKVPTGPAAVNPLAGVLSLLRLDDVQPASAFDATELEPVVATWTTVQGVTVAAQLYAQGDQHYARFDARFEQPATPATDSDVDVDVDVDVEGNADAARERAQRIAARTTGWVYRLSSARYQQMTRRAEDFLRDADAE